MMLLRSFERSQLATIAAVVVFLAALLGASALVGGCAGDTDETSTDLPAQTGTTPVTEGPSTDPTRPDPTTATSDPPVTATSEPVDEPEPTPPTAPRPFETGPAEGQVLTVVAVTEDDVLNFRSAPEPAASIITRAATELVAPRQYPVIEATGVGQAYGDEVWWKVIVDGAEAWANSRFLGALGDADDITPELEQTMPSMEFASAEDLAAAVGEARADGREHRATLVLLEGADSIGSNAWVDVVFAADGSVKGERIEVYVEWVRETDPQTIDGYRILGATSTVICGGLDCSAAAFAPAAALYLAVVGVAGDDVLNFREAPDPTAAILYSQAPRWDGTASSVRSLDRGAFFGSELWWFVSTPDGNAWANARFLGMLGESEDIFAELEGSMSDLTWFDPGYEPPSAENRYPPAPSELTEEIVQDFADRVAAVRGGGEGRVVILGFDRQLPGDGEADPDAVEIWFDLIGLGDDAIKGERINLQLTIVRDGTTRFIGRPLGFEMSAASSIPICGRGVSAEGLCV